MALNRSPEFNSCNPKLSAAELFGTRPPFEQTQKSSTMQSTIPNFKHLSQGVLKLQIFFILPMYFYASNSGAPGVWPFGSSDLVLNVAASKCTSSVFVCLFCCFTSTVNI